MADTSKDTIYIDIDDEITGIIDKLRASKAKVIALVLPKRAAVLQSIVNMKLLKRAADDSKKHVVLITSEAGLMPLAGMVGLYIAKSLTSKPEIPTPPTTDDSEETVEEAADMNEPAAFDPTAAGSMAVGALAGLPPKDDVETVELDNDELPKAGTGSDEPIKAEKPKKEKKPKKDKSLHVPNFERFRLLLIILVVLLILLIVGAVFALNVLPKAAIDIQTNASNINVSENLNLSTTASSLNQASNTVPATLSQQQKSYSQQVATTGQQNNGAQASGTVTIVNCGPNTVTLPAGTGFSSTNLTYISTQSVTVPISTFSFHGQCLNNGNATVTVQAQNGGSSYNMPAGANFTIADNPQYLSASGSAMTGGTDNIVQTVSQNDINNAKSKISANDSAAKQALEDQLQGQGLYPIAATFNAGTPTVTNSANVGTPASTVTVTEVITYTMFGVHKSDLETIIDSNADNQINTAKQSILNDGLSDAAFSVQNNSSSSAQVNMSVTAEVGPELNVNSIKQEASGKKTGVVQSELSSDPGVTNVNVKLSPFWVTTVPTKLSRVTVTIAKPTNTTTNSNDGNP